MYRIVHTHNYIACTHHDDNDNKNYLLVVLRPFKRFLLGKGVSSTSTFSIFSFP